MCLLYLKTNPTLSKLIPVVVSLERSFLGNTEILRLGIGKRGQLYTQVLQVQLCKLFIQMFEEHIYLVFIIIAQQTLMKKQKIFNPEYLNTE
ncbi:hypothetical protein BMS3Abin08_01092 [bacterium BMS3Abin08]|nr:hypothetical protein BMS3Abin08_01092 [bacterium BMS3Abin08]